MTSEKVLHPGIRILRNLDTVWLAFGLILLLLAVVDSGQLLPTVAFAVQALAGTAPFVLLAILAIGFLKATGAEKSVAVVFQGKELPAIFIAALAGGLTPFCSCEIIPFIAALLAVGTPLSVVMALWLSSPLMDPSIFLITTGELGAQFALAKALFAIVLGLSGGLLVRAMTGSGMFSDVIRPRKTSCGSCAQGAPPLSGRPHWRFWQQKARLAVFLSEIRENGLFLLKWLSFAYLIESLMVTYLPAELIVSVVGGSGLLPIVLSALIGAPAYLNGYAAPALVSGLMEQGMSGGAGMAFVMAGGVTSIPTMTAVFALVRKQVFAVYLGMGFLGAVIAGIFYNLLLSA